MGTAAIPSTVLLLATAAWTLVLGRAETRFAGASVVLMAVSLWTATVASLTGMLVARSRWARRTGLGITVAHAALAVAVPADPIWWVALGLSATAAMLLSGPWLTGVLRSRPHATGPPTRAVLVPLVLVGTPFAVGLAGGQGGAALAVGGLALLAAFWFIRTLPWALTVVRFVWPLAAVALAWPLGLPAGVVAAAAGVAVAVLAWNKSVTRAVIPLVERGSVVRIPPELAPGEVLDAARLDERGRPR